MYKKKTFQIIWINQYFSRANDKKLSILLLDLLQGNVILIQLIFVVLNSEVKSLLEKKPYLKCFDFRIDNGCHIFWGLQLFPAEDHRLQRPHSFSFRFLVLLLVVNAPGLNNCSEFIKTIYGSYLMWKKWITKKKKMIENYLM